MTPRERLMATLDGERTDRVPIYTQIPFAVGEEGFRPGPFHGYDDYDNWRECDPEYWKLVKRMEKECDNFFIWRPKCMSSDQYFIPPSMVEELPSIERNGRIETVWQMKWDNVVLSQKKGVQPGTGHTWQIEHYCKTADDARALLEIPWQGEPVNADDFPGIVKYLGDKGVVWVTIPSPLLVVCRLFDPMDFLIFTATERELIDRLMETYNTIIKRIKIAIKYGIMDFLMAMPSWGALNDEEMRRFFVDVCGSFPGCRFLNYNLPRAKRVISPEEFENLAREIPNRVGAKFCSKDLFVVRDMSTNKSGLTFFVNEIALIHGNWLGECGLLSSVGNINIRKTLEFFNATINGDTNTALKLGKELAGVHRGLSICCSKGRMDGAYDKLYAKLINPEFPLRLLPPYTGFTDGEFESFRLYIKNNYPDWLEPQSKY